ncbi:MAG: cation-transporting P-type ATPase, partial [Asgard group archaeon]|nr:cation-transporting P-type ATPase [Asgard group archaeon]
MSSQDSYNHERMDWHCLELEDLLSKVRTDPTRGLESSESESRLELHGKNSVPIKKGSFWKVYLAPLFNIMITVYLIVVCIYFFFAIWNVTAAYQAFTTFLIIGFNFIVSVAQQYRSQKKIDALHKMATPSANVIRDGVVKEISSEELVPGDIIKLGPGDRIPADGRIITSASLEVNESVLTGESLPISKSNGNYALSSDTALAERFNMVFQGTYVQTGTTLVVVVKTGIHTEMGKITSELSEVEMEQIPLVKKVNKIGLWLTIAMLILLSTSATIRLFDLSRKGKIGDMNEVSANMTTCLISALGIMPINIPILTTIVLFTGVLEMARHRVIINNLSSIESLGRISVLCSDKTGTITKGQMTVRRIHDGVSNYGVTGRGYGPSGVIYPLRTSTNIEIPENYIPDALHVAKPLGNLELLLIGGMMNNDAELVVKDYIEVTDQETWKSTGSATDAALLALFNKSGLDRAQILTDHFLLRDFPFDSRTKCMSKVFRKQDDNSTIAYTKGAAEVLLPQCSFYATCGLIDIRPMSEEKLEEIYSLINEYESQGYRVLVMCFKPIVELPNEEDEDGRNKIENDMIYLGFVSLLDPPREGVDVSVAECYSAGIHPIMITGDSVVTAKTIAASTGIYQSQNQYFQGEITDAYSNDDFFNTTIFARVSPKDKQVIIERYQKQDRVVAMTGDGVNDALALTKANVGIAMGIA